MTKRKTTSEFVSDAKRVHKNKYKYTNTIYKNCKTKLAIVCEIHGEFWQTPNGHLRGLGCGKCGKTQKLTQAEFIEKAKEIHGDKYNYSKVKYTLSRCKIIIICDIHGEFLQEANSHLLGNGCIKCSHIKLRNDRVSSEEEFIEKSIKLYGSDRFDYSQVKYIKSGKKIKLICKIHNLCFEQTPNSHLSEKNGCFRCYTGNYSQPSLRWLDYISNKDNIAIIHMGNSGKEFMIPGTKWKADGYCKETNTIYEFYGDYWHGNPNKYNHDDINKRTKKTFKELYDYTVQREDKIRSLGYNLVTIWESDWKKISCELV